MPAAAYAAVIAGVLAVAWVAWRWMRSEPRAMKQFARDLVEHPDYYEGIDEEQLLHVKAMDEARAAPPPSPAEFPRLIDDLLSQEERRVRVARNRLEKVSTEAEQLLLAALSDPRATWTPDQTEVGESSPAQRLSRLLAAIRNHAAQVRIDPPR